MLVRGVAERACRESFGKMEQFYIFTPTQELNIDSKPVTLTPLPPRDPTKKSEPGRV